VITGAPSQGVGRRFDLPSRTANRVSTLEGRSIESLITINKG
jgi:hypothetical protein